MDAGVGQIYSVRFAADLRLLLRARYDGELPKAAVVARDLRAFTGGRVPISAETVRRWMRGLSLPALESFGVLCAFLRLTPEQSMALLCLADFGGGVRQETDDAEGAVRKLIHRRVERMSREELQALLVLTRSGAVADAASYSPPPPPLT